MKTMRIPLLCALGVAIIGIIFGSFFDLSISSTIASSQNNFALAVSAIAPTIGFGSVATMGGGLVALAIKGKYHIALKILLFALAAGCIGVSIYYPAGEYFGINGFYGAAPKWFGYFISVPVESAIFVGGYFLYKDCQNKNMWIVFASVIALLCVALLLVIPTIKDNMHRPRFRFITNADISLFHNWWEPCKDYKDLMTQYDTASDNFKSFPSGHTAEAAIFFSGVVFLPLANEKFKGIQIYLFIFACALTLLTAFARILAAAHFLSDVSFGATIMLVLIFIANEIIMRVKTLHVENQQPENEAN